ncbi:MAG TPA: winged helix-turn-helix domain-containing protein [Terriglobales bacterium]
MPGEPPTIFRFGVFEADTASGELRKSGVRLRVQEQPFQALVLLLERSGDVVTRDELRQKLWPSDTFVDFDHSLNTIINKLREALGDTASNPRFIETLAKRGYRFLIPVESVSNHRSPGDLAQEAHPSLAPDAPGPPAHIEEPPTSLLTSPRELPDAPHGYVRIFFLLIQIMYLCFYIAALARLAAIQELLDQSFGSALWITIILIVSAAIGIPLRLYLLSAVAFDIKDLSRKFLRIFPATFLLDELWALAPFLLAPQIGFGLALGVTAALIYLPFAQRSLMLMRAKARARKL